MTAIAVVNHSTLLTEDVVRAALPDFQLQISRDFEPVWGRGAWLHFVPAGHTSAPTAWQIVLLDDSDQANALGYHDLTPDGLPLAKVFVRTTEQAGDSWTVVFTHELLEMLADPFINSVVYLDDGSGSSGALYPVEICDPVESDQFGYTVGKTLCSDFVYPAWFRPGSKGPWDQQHHLSQPLFVAQDGYMDVAPVQLPSGWQQVTGDLRAPKPDVGPARTKA